MNFKHRAPQLLKLEDVQAWMATNAIPYASGPIGGCNNDRKTLFFYPDGKFCIETRRDWNGRVYTEVCVSLPYNFVEEAVEAYNNVR